MGDGLRHGRAWLCAATILCLALAGMAALSLLSPKAAATQPIGPTPTAAATATSAATATATPVSTDGCSGTQPCPPGPDDALVQEARALTDSLRQAARVPASAPSDLVRQAERRRTLLVSLATSRPQAVLDLSLQATERAALPDPVRRLIEERVTIDGELQSAFGNLTSWG